MNINYITLEPNRVPRRQGLTCARYTAGRGFSSTTGEVLIPEFLVAGQPSGSRWTSSPANLSGLIPVERSIRFAEIISGDGSRVFRERIDLADTGSFSQQTVRRRLDLSGRKWVRLEAWDVATNGSYTQPVWLGTSSR